MQKINLGKPALIFVAAAAVLLLELLVLFPWEVNQISTLTKKTGKVIEQLNLVENEWPGKDKYLQGKEVLKEEIQKVHGKFVTRDQESRPLSFISAGSKNFGIEINSLSPDELRSYVSTKFGKFKYLPIKVKAKGNFHNLAMFLDYLTHSRYFFEVKELTILSGSPYAFVEMTICAAVEVE